MSLDAEELEYQLEVQLERRTALRSENLERMLSRKKIEQEFLEVFDLIGGVPRLALWANDPRNYGEFLKHYMKLAPKEVEGVQERNFTYVSNVPQSPLNRQIAKDEEAVDAEVVDDGRDGN